MAFLRTSLDQWLQLARPEWRALGALLVTLLAGPALSGAEAVSKEYQVKAVFLWRLAQFVEWPTNRFETTNSPIVIGVFGENPFGDALELVLRGETAQGRPLTVRYLKNESEAGACHALFICRSESQRIRQILARTRQRGLLTVSDIEEGFLENGGIVMFGTEAKKVRITINMDAAEAARIVLDARLLRIAEVVRKLDP